MGLPFGALAGLSIGANLASGLVGTFSERARIRKLRRELQANLRQYEDQRRARAAGLSQGEGALLQSVAAQTMAQGAQRGTLRSTFTAAAMNRNMAPILRQRELDIQDMDQRILAMKQAIAQNTSMPGYGAAFAGMLGEAGDIASQKAGRLLQDQMFASRIKTLQDYGLLGGGRSSSFDPSERFWDFEPGYSNVG